jgi:PAS domain S-box-containing protein
MIVAGICGFIYQGLGYYYRFPDSAALISVTSEAILFIIIAFLITYFIEQIRAGEAQYRSVFEHSQLGIVVIDRMDFRIHRTNARIASMLRFSVEELNSIPFTSLFLDPTEKNWFLDRIDDQGDGQDFESRFRTGDGESIWINLSWNRMDNGLISATIVNINARKVAEKANHDHMQKYQQLTENSPTGILILQEGIIRFSNPAFSHFSGYRPGELPGMDFTGMLDPADRDRFRSFSEDPGRFGGAATQTEFRLVTKSGEVRAAVLFANPIFDRGQPAVMINLIDISVQQRLEEKIHQDNERRRGIIITVAHELRTPLQPILGYLNLLIQDPQGFGILDDTKKMLERCLVSVERERQIIKQMLDLSVLESGKLNLSYSNFSLASLVNSVLDAGGYLGKSDVTLDLPQDLIVSADMDRLYSVLDSLLANAVNYSKPPRTIRIAYLPSADGTFHMISVKDNGIGIADTMFTSIFEPFQLADAVKLSRKYDRLGLSLSIAKKIMQMHGGDITVESVVNAGSTFTVHLPRARPEHG